MTVVRKATLLALDITTTEFAMAVRDAEGTEDYVSLPMRGSTCWRSDKNFPAFQTEEVAGMIADLLAELEAKGWTFDRPDADNPRYVSVACRQHDMVVLDQEGEPLLPAISWQCNAAIDEVHQLKQKGVEQSVGTIEPRFVLPKLACVLNRDPALRAKVATVFMTGDWVAWMLTGNKTLSTSDALSNGLLDQQTRERADGALTAAGFDLAWFPAVAGSGTVVGAVRPLDSVKDDSWNGIRTRLQGWQFVAGLGDNHASAVGCGMTDDYKKLVVSGGTSGTINLSCPATARLPDNGGSLQFEFYGNSLLLLQMLGDCGDWYNRFLAQFAPGFDSCLNDLNLLALSCDGNAVRRVLHDDVHHREQFPLAWADAPMGVRVASTQFSIVLELLLRAKRMLAEVSQANLPRVETFVLTGGLSQSLFFQYGFYTGVKLLDPQAEVKVSGRTGPLRYKTSAYGALTNAELPSAGGSLAAIHEGTGRFPLADCAAPGPDWAEHLEYLLRSYGI